MEPARDAETLFKLIYGAAVGSIPNFGGHHGIHGMMRGLREELMKQTGIVCNKIRSLSLNEDERNGYIALCQTAVATEVLSENDLKTIIYIMERNA